MFKTMFLSIMMLSAALTWAQQPKTQNVVGQVRDTSGAPVAGAEVHIDELNRLLSTDEEGKFTFSNVPVGTYTLHVVSETYGDQVFRIEVGRDQATELNITFDLSIHEDLSVTATPRRKSISEIAQAISVLGEEDLQLKVQPTLGETLANEPGVSSSGFGTGSSRPIIRGMGGDRIRVLEGGIGTGDASTVSADHAVTTDTLSAERVEILRGPASLRYGSTAVGGVVNVVDNRIPEFVPAAPLEGKITLGGDTVADQRLGSLILDGGRKNFAWHVDFSATDADPYEIPGRPNLEDEEGHDDEHEGDEDHEGEDDHEDEHSDEEFTGELLNSQLEKQKGAIGFSWITDRGFIGVSYSRFETLYGIPGEGHHHEGEEHHDEDHEERAFLNMLMKEDHDHEDDHEDEHEEEAEVVRIDMQQRRFDVRGRLRFDNGPFESVDARLGVTDYEHVELESNEIGTTFGNDYREFRAEAIHRPWGVLEGSIGMQWTDRDFEAVGAEAFVPPNETRKTALFIFEEWEREHWILSFGGRYERQTTEGVFQGDSGPRLVDADFDGFSSALGLVLGRKSDYGLALHLTRTERGPTPEELLSFGPHLATLTFEVGNPDLDQETSLGLDVTFRKKAGLVTGEVNLFRNDFDKFIFLDRVQGTEADGLPLFIYQQEDATFTGGELHADVTLYHIDPHHLHIEFFYDTVRADLDRGDYLPRITPDRWGTVLEYRRPTFWGSIEWRRNDRADRLAPGETATAAYDLLNAYAGYRFFVGSTSHQLTLRGHNLTDEEARNHNSFLKDGVLLPGRNISLTYSLMF